MNWLEESVKRSKKLKDHYMLGNVDIYIKDQLPNHIDVDFVIIKKLAPKIVEGVDNLKKWSENL